jgi:hypothetical protein
MSSSIERQAGNKRAARLHKQLGDMCAANMLVLVGLVIGVVEPGSVCFRVGFPGSDIGLSVGCSWEFSYDTCPVGPDGNLIYDRFDYEDDVWYHETADDVYREIVRMYQLLSKTGVGAEKTENTEDTDSKVEDTDCKVES